jgi:mannose-6-phosphate isomerase-like protein (cupin superfamily)
MIIDFENIKEEAVMNFKGGNGELDTRNFVDPKNKIMLSRLKPGASSGFHKHEQNSEIVFIISGTGHFDYDDTKESVGKGSVHYCPMGHSHAMFNDGDDDLVYLAIVPEHH